MNSTIDKGFRNTCKTWIPLFKTVKMWMIFYIQWQQVPHLVIFFFKLNFKDGLKRSTVYKFPNRK